MTVYGLRERHIMTHPNSHFFDRETLKFFGERMSDMRILKNTEKIKSISEETHDCYVLSSLQRNAPNGPKRTFHYFDTATYDHVIV